MTPVIALLMAGTALNICGAVATLIWRKEGVTVAALWLAGSTAAAHPERYVRPDRVRIVRVLNMTGVSLALVGVLALVARALWHA
jgi:hypothetical protein